MTVTFNPLHRPWLERHNAQRYRQTDRRTDRRHYDANSLSYRVQYDLQKADAVVGTCLWGGAENAGRENDGREIDGPNVQAMKLQDMTMHDMKIAGYISAGYETD